MFTVVSIHVLQCRNIKCGNEIFRLVKTLQTVTLIKEILIDCWKFSLTTNPLQEIKLEIENAYLSLPKESVQHETIEQKQAAVDTSWATVESNHETKDSIQDTVESSQDNEAFTQYKNYVGGLDLKVKQEHLKLKSKIS